MSSWIRYYSETVYLNKYRSYYTLSKSQKDIVDEYGRGGVGPRNTHLSSKKCDFVKVRNNGGFRPSHIH